MSKVYPAWPPPTGFFAHAVGNLLRSIGKFASLRAAIDHAAAVKASTTRALQLASASKLAALDLALRLPRKDDVHVILIATNLPGV